MTMYEETLEMLQDANIQEVAEATGLAPRWLYYLKRGRWDDPGVQKVQRLHEYLKQRKEQAAA